MAAIGNFIHCIFVKFAFLHLEFKRVFSFLQQFSCVSEADFSGILLFFLFAPPPVFCFVLLRRRYKYATQKALCLKNRGKRAGRLFETALSK